MSDETKYYHHSGKQTVRKVYPVSVSEVIFKGRHSGWECSQWWQHMGASFGYDPEKEMWDRPIENNVSRKYQNTGDTRERALGFFGDRRKAAEGEVEISPEEYAALYKEYEEKATSRGKVP